MQDAPSERWLPLAEAALELGISTDTARRRLRKGQLVGEQRPTPQGFTWWVRIGVTATSATAPMQPAQPGLVELVGLVDRLQRENMQLAGLVGSLQERNANLEAQLALPPASQERPFLRDSEGSSLESTQTPSERHNGRPWWQRWLHAGA